MGFLQDAVLFMTAALIVVPLGKRLGLSPVLGYLGAGVLIGPWGTNLIGDAEGVLHFAEIGVVFLLFLIGLELQPRRLRVMRREVFGLGSAQVAISTLVFLEQAPSPDSTPRRACSQVSHSHSQAQRSSCSCSAKPASCNHHTAGLRSVSCCSRMRQ